MKKKIFYLFFLCFFYINGSYSQISDSTLVVAKQAFYLIPDTTISIDLTNSIRSFLKASYDQEDLSSFIDPVYLKESVDPFLWLKNFVSRMKSEQRKIRPTLLTVLPIDNQKYMIKVAYLSVSKNDLVSSELNLLTSVEIRKVGDKFLFYNSIDYNTRSFNTKQVGNIKYIYPNKLDVGKAKKMDDFNTSFAKKFNLAPLPITYYKFENPEQLFKMLGFDYIENMYYSLSGGLAYQWTNTLLAGNNSELYEHEAVHFYTSILFQDKTRVVDEGYATYIGGSGGIDLSTLAVFAKKYINSHNSADISELSTNFQIRLEGGVPITYILSGLVCRDIEENLGIEGIKKLFTPNQNEDYFMTLERVNGVSKKNFNSYIKRLLLNY